MNPYDDPNDATRRSIRPEVDHSLELTRPANPVYAETAYQRPAAEHAVPERVGRQTHKRKKKQTAGPRTLKSVVVGIGGGFATLVLLAVGMVVGGYAYLQFFGLINPGVRVGDVRLGFLSREQATVVLEREWNSDNGLLLDDGSRTWFARPDEFGITLAPGATAQAALNYGHAGSILSEFADLFSSALRGQQIDPVVVINEELARAALEARADDIMLAPQNATVEIGEDGKLYTVDGIPGHELDVNGTLARLAADPSGALADGYLPLVLNPIPPDVADASAAIEQMLVLLDSPIEMTAYDPIKDEEQSWTIQPDIIASWLEVSETGAGPQIVVSPAKLEAYTLELSASLGDGRSIDAAASADIILAALEADREAVLTMVYPPSTYMVQAGQTLTAVSWDVGIPYWRIIDANPGLNPDALNPGDVLTIPSRNEVLPLPIVREKRVVVDISEQRAWAYENEGLYREYVISTGIDRSPTQPGVFQVQTHEPVAYASLWDLTMPNFIGIYEAWPGFMNGFHGLPTLSSGNVLWGDILGTPASYGCIILDLDEAAQLYDWAEEGTVVEIRQ